MRQSERSLQQLLAQEHKLREVYLLTIPNLSLPIVREKMRTWVGEGDKHILALERALEKMGEVIPEKVPSPTITLPPDLSDHSLLQYLYKEEERQYYLNLNVYKEVGEEWLRSLLSSHIQDQLNHLFWIQNVYSGLLYY